MMSMRMVSTHVPDCRILFTFVSCEIESPVPKGEDYTDENGIRTIIEYIINDEGKKVKVRIPFRFNISRLSFIISVFP